MRKYILNGSVIGAAFGIISLIKATREGPRDWRLLLMWIAWGLSVVIAVATVQRDSQEELEEYEDRRLQ